MALPFLFSMDYRLNKYWMGNFSVVIILEVDVKSKEVWSFSKE
jgi:hypothetical protein